jgi:hypothetical protein
MSDLFDAAAELEAIATGRPLYQTLAELKGAPRVPLLPADGLGFSVDANGKRKRHSHRCKRCRYSVYCYKGGCTLPQRIERCRCCS